ICEHQVEAACKKAILRNETFVVMVDMVFSHWRECMNMATIKGSYSTLKIWPTFQIVVNLGGD
ncbi:hypothetical protein CY34DRAFT_44187, partial [Suillus luteus UH-Slu-Lm8-n1]